MARLGFEPRTNGL